MSLQLAAQHLASRGRGPDTMLVHMAPSEVRGLQALARAHGGTLTKNPDTGLPEAGFLSSILPMIAGVALGPAGLGLTAMQAALATGAVGTLATGSLRKGLMAGLGAYGGAGLGGAIGDIGARAIGAGVPASVSAATPIAQAISPEAFAGFPDLAATPLPAAVTSPVTQSAIQATPIVSSTPPAYLQGAVDPFGGFPGAARSAGAYTVDPYGGFPGGTATPQPAQAVAAPARVSDVVAAPAAPTPTPAMAARPEFAADYRNQMDIASDIAAPREAALREAGPMGRFTRGLQEVAKKPSELFKKENMRYGLAALAPLMMQDQKATQYQGSGPNPYRYAYDPGRVANPVRAGGVGEYQFFNPVYTRMAEGGTVQDMSDRNQAETLLANGGQRFADGGEITPPKYVFDPVTNTLKDVTAIQPVRTITRMPGTQFDPFALGGEQPTPVDPANALNPVTGQPTGFVTALANMANAVGVTTPQQGFLGALPLALVTGSPLGLLFGAAMGNAAQIQNQSNINNTMSAYLENQVNPAAGAGMKSSDPSVYGSMGYGFTGNPNAQAGAPVVDLSTYGPGTFGGNNFGADNEDAAMGAAVAAAQEAAAAQAAANAVSDAVVASDASSGVPGSDAGPSSDGGGGSGADGPGGGSGDLARGGIAAYGYGGISALHGAFSKGGGYNLGDYSDGGRLLKGPGDGVSDSIPASIANKRPARLADGEFVVPARIVSELGNGSTNAGARKLYAMMDRIQKNRGKTVGKGKVAVNSRSDKLLPA